MGRLGFFTFISRQLTKQPPVLKADLTGKTVLVLGANTGLGFEATKHFATMNPARLILACRSQSRGQAALDSMLQPFLLCTVFDPPPELQADTGYSKAELWLVDLADFDSVKQFADRFESDGGRLDILVENAAIAASTYKPTKDGWEASFVHPSINLN
jgi:NAD(P)-dependent dehydrogenase (short-subunit alcohol dehydrogenase family)